ncbi:DUF5336 domain-containing protein [Amycolatopsis sp. FDAARGOS 1241]|uniref:DUF5336 domain-containing protein n=1 Tax=Amycolatopsis sp. FDAARGOS 1241 TaxID=2778070 RepID=UPI00194EFEF6|nr:DUF5336 domain-containing protein [Amycolatopsis sp. FDAARGOS 1241]QRP45290.1 DUF5336 domain-containing protein [Amycolatopsis sp. FDAARGOS 1241]
MTFPSGGPGYPQQGGGQQQPPQGPPPSGGFPHQQPQQGPPPGAGPALPQNLPLVLALVVTVLGVVQYFLGFSDEAGDVGQDTIFLLAGGLLSALHALPRAPKVLPFAALFSVVGALGALDTVVAEQTTPGIVTVVLILGIVQALVSVGALLMEYGILKPPAPKAAVPHYQPTQYSQPGQFPSQQQGEQSSPFAPQPGQYQQPGSTPPGQQPPGQQATTYAPQQGQFFQQPSSEQGKNPGTPPGGFGQQG